ncbi:unnamed protein product [Dracunculus medinensis]|uniref:Protein ECT2 n=1 Tax=Dracunculus medinensis TaxID=318479 RepID=A0A0N4UPK0_DRAME|nr:unnamed protein product [Dracunculus medinensis]
MEESSFIFNETADNSIVDDLQLGENLVNTHLSTRRIKHICVVDTAGNNREILNLLQLNGANKMTLNHLIHTKVQKNYGHNGNYGKDHFGIDVMKNIGDIKCLNDPNVVYLCDDFINSTNFKYLQSCGKFIIGPAIVRSRALQSKPLYIPRPNRPLYSDSMVGVRISLSGLSTRQCRDIVDLVHYMGGSARKKFSASTTHLITEAAIGKAYRMAISMGCIVVHTQWMYAAWAVRDDITVRVTNKEFVNKFLIEPFCGLTLYFIAFPDDELKDMQMKTLENNGKLAQSLQEATHIVISNSPDANIEGMDKQNIVSAEWFWLSIQLGCCANEEIYQWRGAHYFSKKKSLLSPHKIEQNKSIREPTRSNSKSSMDNPENSNSSALPDYSEQFLSSEDLNGSSISSRKFDKRHAVCKEMLETEENYLKALKIVIQLFKEPLEMQLSNPELALLSKTEISQIFSKIPALIEVHEKIHNDLRTYVMHWANDRLIGKVWLDYAAHLEPVYKAFVTNYDVAVNTLDLCDKRPKFHAFLKAAESRPECQRNHIADLLVRPIQRLPSVLLLMKALLKRTDRNNPDHHYLVKAMKAIEQILASANESRRQNDFYTEILGLSSVIDGFPVKIDVNVRDIFFRQIGNCYLVFYLFFENCSVFILQAEILSSARALTGELTVISLGGEDEWSKTRGKKMIIFLFNDVIEIAKVRRNGNENEYPLAISSAGYLSRQFSFSTLRQSKKRFKHYQQYVLTSIRQIDTILYDEIPGLFVISFRVSQCENFWVAQSLESRSGETRKFLQDLAKQIFYLCGRNTIVEETRFDHDAMALGDSDKVAMIGKALQFASHRKPSVSVNFVRPQGTFRRAMSSMQIGLSNTLSRLHSRSNLSSINENSTQNKHNLSIHTSRGLRQILSSSTFFPLRLKRNDSVLHH